jgi:hypothetical protein
VWCWRTCDGPELGLLSPAPCSQTAFEVLLYVKAGGALTQ